MTNGQGVVQYGYDVLGRRSSLAFGPTTSTLKTVGYSYDGVSRPLAITNWNSQSLTYNYAGERLNQLVYPNGITATYGYDGANRLTSLAHLSSGGSTIFGVSYTLDKLGNRVAASENVSGTAQSLSYSYDELSRLTADTNSQTSSSSTYLYDGVGNRSQLQTVGGGTTLTTNYSYDAADHLQTANFNNGISITSYGYDANSNLITETATGTGSYVTGYSYDARTRLSNWQKTGGTNAGTAAFSYDGANTRLSMTYNGTTTSYLQDTQSGLPVVLQETGSGSSGSSSYLYPLGSTTPLYQSAASAGINSWYHTDGLEPISLGN